MPSENEHTGAIFVPRTIDAVERTTRSLVARWAAPVRAIGLRALGLADRLLGHHWGLGHGGPESRGPEHRRPEHRGIIRDEVSGELRVWPLPWYEEESDDEALNRKGPRQRTTAARPAGSSERTPGSSRREELAQAGERSAAAGQGISAGSAPSRAMPASTVEMVPLAATPVEARSQVVPGAGAPAAPAPVRPVTAGMTAVADAIEVAASRDSESPSGATSKVAMSSSSVTAVHERPAAEGSIPVGSGQDMTSVRQPSAAPVEAEMPRPLRAADDSSLAREEQAPLMERGRQARFVTGQETDGTALAERAGMAPVGGTAAVEGAAGVRLAKEWVREMGAVGPQPRMARLPAVFRAGTEVELAPSVALRRIYDHMAWVDGRLAQRGTRHETQAVAEFAWVVGEREEAVESGVRRRSPRAEGLAPPLPTLDSRLRTEAMSRGGAEPSALVESQRGATSAITSALEDGIGVSGGTEKPAAEVLPVASTETAQVTAALGRGDAEHPAAGMVSNASGGAAPWQAPVIRGGRGDAAGSGPDASGVYARDLSSTLSSVIVPSRSAPAGAHRPDERGAAVGASSMQSPSVRAGQEAGFQAPASPREERAQEGTPPLGLVAGVMLSPGGVGASARDVALPELRFATALATDEREGASGGVLHFVDRLIGVRAGWEARPLPVAAPLASALDAVREQVLIDLSSRGVQAAPRGVSRGGSSPARSRSEGQGIAAPVERRDGLPIGAGDEFGGEERGRVVQARGASFPRPESPSLEMAVSAGAAPAMPAMVGSPHAEPATAPGTATRTSWMAPEVSDAGLGLGAIGRRAEQLGGIIGVRAAGVAVDFIDPETFPGTSEARWDVWQMPMVAGAEAGPDAEYAVSPVGGAPLLRGRAEGVPKMAQEMREGGTAQGDGGGSLESGSRPGRSAVSGRIPGRTAVGAKAWAWDREEAWTLTRIFPAAVGAIPAYLRDESAGQVRGPIIQAASRPGMLGASETRVGPSTKGASEGGGRLGGQVGGHRGLEGGALGEVVYVAPEVVRETESSILPGGRAPRGGYLWSRSAEFARDFGTWEPPSTVTAATGGAEAAMSGQPAWQGMTTIETPVVRAALNGSDPMAEGDGGPDGVYGGALARPSPKAGRQAAPSLQLLEGGVSAQEVRRGGTGRHLLPPELELIRPTTVPAAPVNDASARMVEVMQRQSAPVTGGSNRSGGSERLSLSDLTLVAVAAATQQVAASTAPASTTSTTKGGGGRGGVGAGNSQASAMSPEQEHREIEDLARRVLSEVEWLTDAMRDRIGEP